MKIFLKSAKDDDEYDRDGNYSTVAGGGDDELNESTNVMLAGSRDTHQSDEFIIMSDSTNTTTSIQLGGSSAKKTSSTSTSTSRQPTMKGSASSASVDKSSTSSGVGILGIRGGATKTTMTSSNQQTSSTSTNNSKSKTAIDFPDLLQNTMDGSGSQTAGSTTGTSSSSTSKMLLTPSGRPIQSILRRSETPPTTKANLRQTSLDSAESSVSAVLMGGGSNAGIGAGVRETSIEKLLKSTSTSRPLIFNG